VLWKVDLYVASIPPQLVRVFTGVDLVLEHGNESIRVVLHENINASPFSRDHDTVEVP
jgi:hypothetical protein